MKNDKTVRETDSFTIKTEKGRKMERAGDKMRTDRVNVSELFCTASSVTAATMLPS